jgi:hypothetical protein
MTKIPKCDTYGLMGEAFQSDIEYVANRGSVYTIQVTVRGLDLLSLH